MIKATFSVIFSRLFEKIFSNFSAAKLLCSEIPRFSAVLKPISHTVLGIPFFTAGIHWRQSANVIPREITLSSFS